MSDKYKKLFKNIGILTLGQFSSRVLFFLLVPLYTSVLTTEEYGIYDLIYTTISLLCPIATLNISVSTQRFLMDKDVDAVSISKISAKYACIGFIIPIGMVGFNYIVHVSQMLDDFGIQFLLLFSAVEFSGILVEYAVGSEQIKEAAISGVISTLLTLILNVVFLIVLDFGLNGYFIANSLGPIIQACYLFYSLKVWEKIRAKKYPNKKIEKAMLSFCIPQIANTISWWINNAADRYIITWFCGVAVNGVYSVAYKVPSIINVINGIFGQASGIVIVKNYDENDKDAFISKTYIIYNAGIVIACAGLILITKLVSYFMFAKDFYNAWVYVPLLLIASMFGALSGYLGNIFSAEKEAKLFARSTVIGAVINIILNIFLVYWCSAIGAAYATMISYIVVWGMRCFYVSRRIRFEVNLKADIRSYGLLLIQAIVIIYLPGDIITYFIEIILIFILILNNKNSLLLLINALKKMNCPKMESNKSGSKNMK